jgi:hypothetical protein
MGNGNSVLLEGYEFELKGYICSNGTTTVIISVSGDGSAASELSGWIMEICQADFNCNEDLNIVSCEKRKGNGVWMPALAQNTAYELIGDAGISGVLIDENVGSEKSDPEKEFKIVVDKAIESGSFRVAYLSGEDIFVSDKKIPLGALDKTWLTPIEKTFCLYIIVTDGYKPEGACMANVSIIKRNAFVVHERGGFEAGNELSPNNKSVKTVILGSVKITASVPLKSYHASGDTVSASACDCFEIYETLGYSSDEKIEIKDVHIYPKRESFDLTLLNTYCGRSVYRLDGEFIIDCRHCI